MMIPPLPTLKDRHARLRALIGGAAYRALLRGCPLQVWRNSSPHNYWVDSKRGRGHALWHSWEREYPDMGLFRLLKHSAECVIRYWGADSGRPRHSFYALRKRGALKS